MSLWLSSILSPVFQRWAVEVEGSLRMIRTCPFVGPGSRARDFWEAIDLDGPVARHTGVPDGKWFKRFPGMILCGEGELVKTFLLPGQTPIGEEIT